MWNYFYDSVIKKIIGSLQQSYVKTKIVYILFDRNWVLCQLVKVISIYIFALKSLDKVFFKIFFHK